MNRFLALPVALALLLLLSACEPKDRRPGTWLSGEVVDPLPTDWSFIADHPEIYVETRPWYGIPFSVTTVIGTRDGKLYVPSIYDEEAAFPGSKYWNAVIEDNPEVRLKIGDKIYEMQATWVRDLEEYRQGAGALADKYDSWAGWLENEDKAPYFVIIRMDPRG
ncbi:MAG: hypothetical protein AAGE43_10595 [Pseudomonadota bacterium]